MLSQKNYRKIYNMWCKFCGNTFEYSTSTRPMDVCWKCHKLVYTYTIVKEPEMRKIIFEPKDELIIYFDDLSEDKPIFLKKDGKLVGMVVEEKDKGWILRTGGPFGVAGYYEELKDCLIKGLEFDYEYYIED